MRTNGVLEAMQTEMRERTKDYRKRTNLNLTRHDLRLLYNKFDSQARGRGYCFTITLGQFEDLMASPCAYGSGRRPSIRIGLDRKDSSQGYTLDNTVACCARHNRIKSDIFSYSDMVRIGVIFDNARDCGNTQGGRKKTHRMHSKCSHGHVLSKDNVYIHRDGRIVCAICSRARLEAWKLAKLTH
jgi:hypothetical protein